MNVSTKTKIADVGIFPGSVVARRTAGLLCRVGLGLGLGLGFGLGPAAAQQPQQPPPWPTAPPKAAATPKAQPKAQPKAAAKEEAGAGTAKSTETQLRQRVEQLEEQLADMQVTMGTLESFGKPGSGPATGSQGSGAARSGGGGSSVADQARIDSLETQIRALATQVEQLSAQVRQSARRSDIDPAPATRPDLAQVPGLGSGPGPGNGPGPTQGFGRVTVTPGGDPIGRMIETPPASPVAALPPEAQAAGNPKQLYEVAYTYLLQQDYGSAEVAFEEFLRRYPADRQAADAQYWYGETLYVQRRYKPAAQAFLKVVDKYGASAKVPNSILKLAMTLEQLGQKDCGLFTTLESNHPNAPVDVKTKALALKQRVGC